MAAIVSSFMTAGIAPVSAADEAAEVSAELELDELEPPQAAAIMATTTTSAIVRSALRRFQFFMRIPPRIASREV